MVTVIKYSDTIPPQEYEKKRDEVIKLLTRMNGNLLSLDFLNYHLKLDEKYLPAYVVAAWWMKVFLTLEGSIT